MYAYIFKVFIESWQGNIEVLNMAKRKKRAKKSKKRVAKQRLTFFKSALYFAAALVITLGVYIGYCFLTLPDIEEAVMRTRQPSTTIIAENGNEIQTFGQVYSEVIRSEELPQYVIDAIISTEDRRFYSHFGFDIISFSRAMITNIFLGRYAQGGSTITQQVAKNLFLTPNKTIKRKIQELLLAFWLENKFTKEQILTLYLNRVYLGTGTYGIEAASQKYFQKTSRDLNMKEAAIIAGMLKAPSRYNPIASMERAVNRAKVVLQNMVNNRTITEEERDTALKMRVGPEKSYKVEGAKYFADWVYNETNDYIGERENDVYVYTTLDQELQQKAEKALQRNIAANAGKNVTQGAVVILDKKGAVLAMAGGVNYEKSQYNRATQAWRQPGSAFKPFIYLEALQEGWEPEDKLQDKPVSIRGWKPENISKKYYGEVTFREALIRSLNLATIDLTRQISIPKTIKLARKMGITTPLENSAALALGVSEVKVLDMAAAYASIANGGYAVWPYAVKEIYTRDGYQIFVRSNEEPDRIIKEKHIEQLTSILEKVIEKGTGKAARIGRFAAGKTGTSQDYRDAWFAGFTDEFICVVWVGNDDSSPMKGVSGGNLPAKIWKEIMQ